MRATRRYYSHLDASFLLGDGHRRGRLGDIVEVGAAGRALLASLDPEVDVHVGLNERRTRRREGWFNTSEAAGEGGAKHSCDMVGCKLATRTASQIGWRAVQEWMDADMDCGMQPTTFE